ncbi:DUF6506 family protein [Anaerosacchariphilus polymeriproducens]|uniref:Uncharacterized protein n=1 Tax=Anaerosacchariphilus polymeriproducens TaxID=1812858 RepID=A0A371AZY8_9FIRM|nr:DUF6506 family protein [Anaerosacchariphilus polymeriproducens]RDU25062.1 hypothetical protein DWV06_00750 [Anaerosacchariphilus polymeriproducens]
MKLKAAFMFIAPEANPKNHKTVVDTPNVSLTVVGVDNYQEAEKVAIELAEEGITAIELCAGFGIEGTAIVNRAVKGKAVIGAVRFDNHPGFNYKSGDELF